LYSFLESHPEVLKEPLAKDLVKALPDSSDSLISTEIDDILTRLDEDIPSLRREMDELLARIRIPGTAAA
jgi:hypothetical protein